MSEWKKYEGTDEQITEMLNAEHGFIVRWKDDIESLDYSGDCSAEYITNILGDFTDYLICNPHPLADMIERWARTGQPVWVKGSIYDPLTTERFFSEPYETTMPDWSIPGAEYSFTPMPPAEAPNPGPHAPSTDIGPEVPEHG